jgi:hypothetical protein
MSHPMSKQTNKQTNIEWLNQVIWNVLRPTCNKRSSLASATLRQLIFTIITNARPASYVGPQAPHIAVNSICMGQHYTGPLKPWAPVLIKELQRVRTNRRAPVAGRHSAARFAAPPFHELKKQQMKTDGRHCAKADCFVARRALGIASQCSAPPRSRSRSVKRQRATRRRSAPSLTRGRSDATQDSVVRPPSDQTKSGLR